MFLCAGTVSAQTQNNRYNVNINPNLNGLVEYLPAGYTTANAQTYPLLISFMGLNAHGSGSDAAALEALYQPGFIPRFVRDGQFPTSFQVGGTGASESFIIITPQFVTNFNTRRPTPNEINDLINWTINEYKTSLPGTATKIDTTRIYLVGNSSGAQLPWDYTGYTSAYADRIAAIIPIAGTSFSSEEKGNKIKYADIDVWAFHNTNDPLVPFSLTDEYIRMLRQAPSANNEIRFTTPTPPTPFHDLSYNIYSGIYEEGGMNIYEWVLQSRRTLSKANAGVDQDITLPAGASTQLHGLGTGIDGNPGAFNWEKISGPSSGTAAVSGPNPTINGLVEGTYVYRLGITNSSGTSTDEVTIRVYPPRIQAESFVAASPFIDNAPADQLDEDGTIVKSNFSSGKWMDYNINVPAGDYVVRYRFSNFFGASTQFVLKNATSGTVYSTMNPYWTEYRNIYITQTDTITLPGGPQTLRIESNGSDFNFNWFQLLAVPNLSPLPVNFTLFNSNCNNGTVSLIWKTSGETDSRNFVVERSNDGRNWQAITTLAASGQSTSERSYTYSDAGATSSSMYRIAEIGLNGRTSYSSVIKGNCAGNRLFSVYPNPVKDHTVIDISVDQKSKLNITLVDVRGAVVQQQEVSVLKGTNQVDVNMSSLPKGTYTLMVQWDNEVRSAKLVKN